MRLLLAICVLVVLTFPRPCFAQQQVSRQAGLTIEDRISIIATIPQNKEYVNEVNQLVELMMRRNYPADTILKWVLKGEYVADKLEYQEGLRDLYRSRAVVYETIGRDYPNALHWYNAVLALAETDDEHHRVYTSILNLYFYLGDYVHAMSTAATALRMAENAKDLPMIAHYQNVVGFIHLRQNNASAALQSYEQYHRLSMVLRDTVMMADAYNCLAEAWILNGDYDQALHYLFLSSAIYERLDQARKLNKGDRIPYTLFKIGFVYGSMQENEKAIGYVEKALEATKTNSCNLYDVANYYIYAGNLYRQLNQLQRSHQMLAYGLSLAKQIEHKEDIRDGYLYLHQLFASTGKYDSAYHYYVLYDKLKDSISNENTRREIRGIEATYKIEKKDREIELLRQQAELIQEASNRKLLIRNLVILFFILVAVIIGFILNRRELRRKNLQQQEINKRQNEIFNVVSSTQDQERKRIAQDLHDGMGSLLSAAKLKLSGMQTNNGIEDTIRILDDASVELRNIAHNIMPATLSRIGLTGALQNFFGRMKDGPLQFHFTHHGFDERIDEEKEILLYRVVLELVNNVVKHAKAKNVTIQLLKYPESINLIVEDDGIGMAGETNREEGTGLRNIASRVSYLKGNFSVDSGARGTTVIIDLPA